MTDNRFPEPGVDNRFPSPGVDTYFDTIGVDTRFPSPGVDTRFDGALLETLVQIARGSPDVYLVRLSEPPTDNSDIGAVLSLSDLQLDDNLVAPNETLISPELGVPNDLGNISGSNRTLLTLSSTPAVGTWCLFEYEIGPQSTFDNLFPQVANSPISNGGVPFAVTPGKHRYLVQILNNNSGAVVVTNGAGEVVSVSFKPAQWTYTIPDNSENLAITSEITRGDVVQPVASVTVPVAGEWWVSGTGSDTTGVGSEGSPFRQFSAVTAPSPGDDIFGMDGVFDPFEVPASGTSGNLITYKAATGHTPIIRGELQSHITQGGSIESTLPTDKRDGIRIDSKDYIRIEGMTIEWVWRNGIFVVGTVSEQHGNHEIVDNLCQDVGRSGIYVGGNNSDSVIPSGETSSLRTDTVLIDDNEVTRTNLEIDQQGFGNVEGISVAASVSNITVSNNHVHDTLQYGIDIKAGVDGFAVFGNLVENTERHGIYVDAGQRFVKNGGIYNNIVKGCRHGIVLARENGAGSNAFLSLNGIDVYNNEISEIDQIGIYAHDHPGDFDSGEIVDIRIRFNTVYNANREGGFKDINIDGWATTYSSATMTGNDFRGNIVYSDETLDQAVDWSASGWTIAENLNVVDGTSTGSDPLFTDASAGDFTLQTGSPAIGLVIAAGGIDVPFDDDIDGTARVLPSSAGASYVNSSPDTIVPVLNSFAVTAQDASGITFDVGVQAGETSYALSVVAVPNGETGPLDDDIVAGEKNDNSNAPLWVDGYTFTVDQTGTTVAFSRADEIQGNVDWYAVVSDPAGNLSNVLSQTGYAVDTVRPAFSSAATNVAGDEITITHSEPLVGSEVPANWPTSVGTPTSVTLAGSTSILAFPASTISNGAVVTVGYTPGNVTDSLGNALQAYAAQPVTNNVPAASGGINISLVSGAAQSWTGGNLATQTYTFPAADFAAGIVAGNEIFFAVGEDKIANSATVNSNAATFVYQSSGGNGGRTSGFKYTLQASDVTAGTVVIDVFISAADDDGVLALFEYGDKTIVDQDGDTYIANTPVDLTATPTAAVNKMLVVAIGNDSQFGSGFPDFGTATQIAKETAIGSDSATGFAYAVLENAAQALTTITITGDVASSNRSGVVLVVIE